MSVQKLSKLSESLKGSEIVRLGNIINERISKGEKIFNYTIGDFDSSEFPIPQELEELIIEAYRNKKTSYPAAQGILDLRKSVSHFIKEWEGIEYSENEIQIAAGGRPLIYAIFKAIVDDGDKVIYAVPSWNNNHYVHLTNAVHCKIDARIENNFMPSAEDVIAEIPGASLICLCTPQNPTGTTLQKETLEKICDAVIAENKKRSDTDKKLYIMFDQMYWTLTYGDTKHFNPVSLRPEMKEYTVFVDGISKVFSATGVRVGWSMGPENVIAKMRAILTHVGAWAPMAEQNAVAKYLTQKNEIEKYLVHFKSEIFERLDRIYNGILEIKKLGFDVDAVSPQAAIYLSIKLNLVGKKTLDDRILQIQSDVTDFILQEAKLAIVPFYAFGTHTDNCWYRLSVGTVKKNDIDIMLQKLTTAISSLK